MGARREAREAAASAAQAEKVSVKQYVDAALREYKPRKGGTAKFKKGSKVLVPHVDQYYAAVVMQGQKRPDGQHYLLHYEGWSHKYDEWVKEDDVQRFDRALLEESAARAGNAPGDLAGRRRKADIAPAEPQLAVEIPQQLRLHIPPLLKRVVLDDSEQINYKGMLLPLPRNAHGRPTVNEILKEYETALAKEAVKEAAKEGAEPPDPQRAEAARVMVAGVRSYFDRGLRHFLLYSHEVEQADSLLAPAPPRPSTPEPAAAGGDVADAAAGGASTAEGGSTAAAEGESPADAPAAAGGKAGGGKGRGGGKKGGKGKAQGPLTPCDIYGAEHLVRLFVKLPELVQVAFMTPPDVVRLEQQLHDLMARMTEVKKQARYFSLPEEYERNPHFNPLLALQHGLMLGAVGGIGGAAGGGTPAPGGAAGTSAGAALLGGAAGGGAASAGTKEGTPAVPDTGANSEAEEEGMDVDG